MRTADEITSAYDSTSGILDLSQVTLDKQNIEPLIEFLKKTKITRLILFFDSLTLSRNDIKQLVQYNTANTITLDLKSGWGIMEVFSLYNQTATTVNLFLNYGSKQEPDCNYQLKDNLNEFFIYNHTATTVNFFIHCEYPLSQEFKNVIEKALESSEFPIHCSLQIHESFNCGEQKTIITKYHSINPFYIKACLLFLYCMHNYEIEIPSELIRLMSLFLLYTNPYFTIQLNHEKLRNHVFPHPIVQHNRLFQPAKQASESFMLLGNTINQLLSQHKNYEVTEIEYNEDKGLIITFNSPNASARFYQLCVNRYELIETQMCSHNFTRHQVLLKDTFNCDFASKKSALTKIGSTEGANSAERYAYWFSEGCKIFQNRQLEQEPSLGPTKQFRC